MSSAQTAGIQIENASIPLQRRPEGSVQELLAELWCEFDCVAYVFTGDDQQEISDRLKAARAGEQTWDYVRPLSKDELYGGLV